VASGTSASTLAFTTTVTLSVGSMSPRLQIIGSTALPAAPVVQLPTVAPAASVTEKPVTTMPGGSRSKRVASTAAEGPLLVITMV